MREGTLLLLVMALLSGSAPAWAAEVLRTPVRMYFESNHQQATVTINTAGHPMVFDNRHGRSSADIAVGELLRRENTLAITLGEELIFESRPSGASLVLYTPLQKKLPTVWKLADLEALEGKAIRVLRKLAWRPTPGATWPAKTTLQFRIDKHWRVDFVPAKTLRVHWRLITRDLDVGFSVNTHEVVPPTGHGGGSGDSEGVLRGTWLKESRNRLEVAVRAGRGTAEVMLCPEYEGLSYPAPMIMCAEGRPRLLEVRLGPGGPPRRIFSFER